MPTKITSQNKSSEKAVEARRKLLELFAQRPLGDEEMLVNLGLYMRSGALAKMLFLDEMYRKIVPIPGSVFEFGVWRGQSLAVLENLRAVHEPYNHARRIVGFDTFTGYPGIGAKDRASDIISKGVYKVGAGYENYLDQVLDYHEQENVMSHIKKHELVKGDATKTVPEYLKRHPETLVAMAYFDMALYEPTIKCLKAVLPRLVKGSLLVFDELCHPDYPGETSAVLETLDLKAWEIRRSAILPDRTFVVVG